jgi:hypothetical protein
MGDLPERSQLPTRKSGARTVAFGRLNSFPLRSKYDVVMIHIDGRGVALAPSPEKRYPAIG